MLQKCILTACIKLFRNRCVYYEIAAPDTGERDKSTHTIYYLYGWTTNAHTVRLRAGRGHLAVCLRWRVPQQAHVPGGLARWECFDVTWVVDAHHNFDGW